MVLATGDLELTGQQDTALNAVSDWLDRPSRERQVFRLFGYAGTGKTTIARLVSQMTRRAVYCAFTGKAASVLQKKGCEARTIHSLIYSPVPKNKQRAQQLQASLERAQARGAPAGDVRGIQEALREEVARVRTPGFMLNPNSDVRGATIVVLDEASMVGGRLADDLLSYGVPILALGDPAQLPPVRSAGYFTTGKPDVMLTEIVRQAADSPVLRLATAAREGRTLEYGDYGGGTRVVRRGTTPMDELLSYDQVLCGKNVTRRALNRMMREALGRTSKLPVVGDRLVCLKNNHDSGLLNGSQWIVEWAQEDTADMILEIRSADGEGASMSVAAEKGYFLDPDYLSTHSDSDAFDFAYCITTHRAQGSEWPRVYVVDESSVFQGASKNWTYTSLTRARDSVAVSR